MLTRKFYSALLIFLFLAGCEKPDSTPEIRDPIYQDMKSEESRVQKEIDGKIKELEGIKTSQLELPDSDYQKKLNRDEIFRLGNEITRLNQMKEYFRISAESRQIYARKQYLEYYKAGKAESWPPAETKEQYETQKKLSQTPKSWTRGVANKAPAKKPEKKAESSHH